MRRPVRVTASGHASSTLLDVERSLNATAYSDWLREWGACGDTEQAYRENQTLLERLLGLTLSVQTLEQQVVRSAVDVDAFYISAPKLLDFVGYFRNMGVVH